MSRLASRPSSPSVSEQRKADRRASYEFGRLLAAALREGKETAAGILGRLSRAAAHLHHVASPSVAPQQHHDAALELLSGSGHEQNEKLNKTSLHGA
jgi:hypothetical protein